MTRILAILLGAAVVIAAIVVLTTSGSKSDRNGLSANEYRVALDNASGLTTGADFRVAGVTVGSIKKLDLDAKTASAIAVVAVDKPEFAPLTQDTTCTIKPQSLIGEYFMDCQPGKRARLKQGGTIPISNTSGTIPPDLVMNVLRLPYRQKLSIILGELGQGFAARGGDINETIRRAIPALRDTDKVLRILSDERQTLAQLTRNGDTVIGALDGNRGDVARFVAEAGNAAAISARRRNELAGTIRRLPRFQQILRPTLRDLGTAARRQTPALRDLRLAAPSLTTLLNRLGPFADASVPAVRSLGAASVVGTTAVQDARGTVKTLRTVATGAKEPLTNLRFILEHLNDRSNAVEKNPRSPGGAGFTGLEAVLQYFYVQSQAINIFDDKGYILKLNLLVNECSSYTTGSAALADPGRTKRCSAALGPGGKIEPDPPATGTSGGSSTGSGAPTLPGAPSLPAVPGVPAVSGTGAKRAAPNAGSADKPGVTVPGVGTVNVPGLGPSSPKAQSPGTTSNLLDYLLGG
jgi:virulence factor Mce-like protein